jgi:hypothetical protein
VPILLRPHGSRTTPTAQGWVQADGQCDGKEGVGIIRVRREPQLRQIVRPAGRGQERHAAGPVRFERNLTQQPLVVEKELGGRTPCR